MSDYGVSVDKMKDLRRRMLGLKIYEKDLQETFIRSSGPGGQNVNKVSTCVILKHWPSRITVRVQEARTQGLNRFLARCRLIEKIEKRKLADERKKIYERAKRKRQARKRSKASKEKVLETKKRVSRKKSSRRRIAPHKMDDYL